MDMPPLDDYSTLWGALPAAPDFVPRGDYGRLVLRLPEGTIERLSLHAARQGVTVAQVLRTWLFSQPPPVSLDAVHPMPYGETSDLVVCRVAHSDLDSLKRMAHALHCPYNRLARSLVELGLDSDEKEH